MARKKAKPRKKAKRGPDQESIAVKVVLENIEDAADYYINYFEIASSEHEFSILAANVPTRPPTKKLPEIKSSGEFMVEPELRLIVPPTLIPRLIKALQSQFEVFEKGLDEEDGKDRNQ